MRQIKFRQWLLRLKRMNYGIGIEKDGIWVGPSSVTFSVDPIMQFTGLHDKNGKGKTMDNASCGRRMDVEEGE